MPPGETPRDPRSTPNRRSRSPRTRSRSPLPRGNSSKRASRLRSRSPPSRRYSRRYNDVSDSESYSVSDSGSDSHSRDSPPRRTRRVRRRRHYDSSSDDSYSSYSRDSSRSRSPSRNRGYSVRRRGRETRYRGVSDSPRRRYGRDYHKGRGAYGTRDRYREVSPVGRRRRYDDRRRGTGREAEDWERGTRNDKSRGRDERTVLVLKLGPRVRESDVYDYFSRAGSVRDIQLVRGRGGDSDRTGYVEFYDAKSVGRALELRGGILGGTAVTVQAMVDDERTSKDDRRGGRATGKGRDGGKEGPAFDESLVGWSMGGRKPIRQVEDGGKEKDAGAGGQQVVGTQVVQVPQLTGPTEMVSIEELRTLLNPLGLPVPNHMNAGRRGVVSGQGVDRVPLPTVGAGGSGVELKADDGDGFTRLYVGSVSFWLSEEDLRKVFEPFGEISSLQLQRDEGGRSRGYGFVEFVKHESAKKALEINGLELAGRKLKVGLASQENRGGSGSVMKPGSGGMVVKGNSGSGGDEVVPLPGPAGGDLDVAGELDEGKDGGFAMNASQRVMLMQQLSRGEAMGKGKDMEMKESKIETRSLMLSNMFNVAMEEAGFELDLAEDVRDECSASYGKVVHLHVEKESKGLVFVRFEKVEAGKKAVKGLNGRWFGGMQIRAVFVSDDEYAKRFQTDK